MARKKKKPERSLWDMLLAPVDWLCETLSGLAVALLRLIGRGLILLAKGTAALLRFAFRGLMLPFAALYRLLTAKGRRARQCLRLTGEEFEAYVAELLGDNGYKKIELTKASGDQGADILCERSGIRYAVQCKNYQGAVGNWAVQEAYAGMQYYECESAAVICPGTFTRSAKELADSLGVELWDGDKLEAMMRRSGKRPKHRG